MRIVLQRVSRAEVVVEGESVGKIGKGLMLLLGVEDDDSDADISWLAQKVVNMRIFDDENGVMNRSVQDVKGEVIVVSQFTLHASTRKGNRPSYIRASKGEFAEPMYEKFKCEIARLMGKEPAAGRFGADMKCDLLNDGPVTIIIDTKLKE
ncbi:MAG: D-aminoacyl-tRNA deacylase [Rikenellaceae bacterium]